VFEGHITLDFETAWASGLGYTLSKMTTEDYVTDPRFEIIGVSVKVNQSPAEWYAKYEVPHVLSEINWQRSILICQNMLFDGLILHDKFQIVPRFYVDTMLLARPVIAPIAQRVSLAKIGETLNLPTRKGQEVMNANGKWYNDFTPDELKRYGEYCKNDTEMTYSAFKRLVYFFTTTELQVIDSTLRMYLTPQLVLNAQVLAEHLHQVRYKKEWQLNNLPGGVTKEDLKSNQKFAKVLERFGIEPPTKISPANGKVTFAFAKTDVDFKALTKHENPDVQAVMAARLGQKSTLEETRTEKFLKLANTGRLFRNPIKYYGAHTGRFSGMEGLNTQNLPRGGKLRESITPPKGMKIIAADFSQIEARINAWFAGEITMLGSFRGSDVYKDFARVVYKIPGNEPVTDAQRFFGKTCVLGLGYGMAWKKFRLELAKKDIFLADNVVQEVVNQYRQYYNRIPTLWSRCDGAISAMQTGREVAIGPVTFKKGYMLLPNDMFVQYPRLKYVSGADFDVRGWIYTGAKGTTKLYGAKLCENMVQTVARIVMTDAMVRMAAYIHPAMSVHDELIYCVPEQHVVGWAEFIESEMTKTPEWANSDLPLAVEVKYGDNYGACK